MNISNFLAIYDKLRLLFCPIKEESFECAYRGENGTKCAAGCLIEDEKYDNSMEGRAWFIEDWNAATVTDKFNITHSHGALIRSLQIIHDDAEIGDIARGRAGEMRS